jgi:hypothetical protein
MQENVSRLAAFLGRRQHAIASLPIFHGMPSQRRSSLPPYAQASRDRYLDFALISLPVRSEVIREEPSELLANCAVVAQFLALFIGGVVAAPFSFSHSIIVRLKRVQRRASDISGASFNLFEQLASSSVQSSMQLRRI